MNKRRRFWILLPAAVCLALSYLVWRQHGLREAAMTAAVLLLCAAYLYAALLLRRLRWRYRAHEEAGAFTLLADEELTLLDANEAFCRLHGYSPEELRKASGGQYARCIHAGDLAQVRTALENAKARNGGQVQWTARVMTAGGGTRHLLTTCELRHVRGGRFELRGVAVDVTKQKETELALRNQQQLTQLAMTGTTTSIWLYDYATRSILPVGVPGKLDNISPTMENVPQSMIDNGAVHPDSVPAFLEMHEKLFAGAERVDGVFRMQMGRREYFWSHIYYFSLLDENGKPYRAVGRSEDVTAQHESALAYQRELAFRRLMDQNTCYSMIFNATRNTQVLLRADEGPLLGEDGEPITVEEFYKTAAANVVDNAEVRQYFQAVAAERFLGRAKDPQRELTFEYLVRQGDGPTRWVRYDEHLLRDPDTGDLMAFLYVTDIDQQKRKEAALETAARTDQMTGVLNHAATFAEIKRFLQMEGRKEPHALFVLDVDDFKNVNDILGHQSGDKLLQDVGNVLREAFRDSDIIGRVGGDEFMVLMKNIPSAAQAKRKADELLEDLRMIRRVGDRELSLSVSIGLAMRKGDGISFEALYSQADGALYEAKNAGKDRCCLYDGDENAAPAQPPESETTTVQLRWLLGAMDDEMYLCEADPELGLCFRLVNQTIRRDNPDENVLLSTHDPAESDRLRKALTNCLLTGEPLDKLYRAPSESGVPLWRRLRAKPLTSGKGGVSRCLCVLSDVSPLMDPGKLAFLSRNTDTGIHTQEGGIDPVTGQLDKEAFLRRVRVLLDVGSGEGSLIIRCDLDRFKVYNDVFGTTAGDRLLRDFGFALLSILGWDCVAGRIEADHFALFVPGASVDLDELSRRVGAWLGEYSDSIRLSSSIGVYPIEDPEMDVRLMCDRALMALRSIKGGYATSCAVFNEQLRDKLLYEQELLDGMTEALEQQQFQLWYQPQINFNDGSLVGAEALLRWVHPKRGVIMPGEFIPLFERNGFITRLDEYVWEQNCRNMRAWMEKEGLTEPRFPTSVNVSRLDIYNEKLAQTLRELVDKYGIPPASLNLEITESAYIENPDQLIQTVTELQDMGFSVQMDDFGAGYSALNILKDVPVDLIKLDVRFLSGGDDSARGGNILSSVVRMVRWLGLPLIAEGVESQRQALYLKSLGCVYMQGFFFDRPMPVQQFENLLSTCKTGVIDSYRDGGFRYMEDFWNPAQTSLLFNDFAGGAAILEYRNGNVEALRTNDHYYKVLHTTRENYAGDQTHLLDRFSEQNRAIYTAMLEEAIATGQEAECEVESLPYPGRDFTLWTRTRVRLLASSGDSYIFYSSVEDITERKALQSQLTTLQHRHSEQSEAERQNAEAQRTQKLVRLLASSSFEYICIIRPDTGHYSFFTSDGDLEDLSPQAGDFTASTLDVRDTVVIPEDREHFEHCSDLRNILRHLNRNETYKYRYHLLNGLREAEFCWLDLTRKELLMTVRLIGEEQPPER